MPAYQIFLNCIMQFGLYFQSFPLSAENCTSFYANDTHKNTYIKRKILCTKDKIERCFPFKPREIEIYIDFECLRFCFHNHCFISLFLRKMNVFFFVNSLIQKTRNGLGSTQLFPSFKQKVLNKIFWVSTDVTVNLHNK